MALDKYIKSSIIAVGQHRCKWREAMSQRKFTIIVIVVAAVIGAILQVSVEARYPGFGKAGANAFLVLLGLALYRALKMPAL